MFVQQYKVPLHKIKDVYYAQIETADGDLPLGTFISGKDLIISVLHVNDYEDKRTVQTYLVMRAGVKVKTPSMVRFIGTAVQPAETVEVENVTHNLTEAMAYHCFIVTKS